MGWTGFPQRGVPSTSQKLRPSSRNLSQAHLMCLAPLPLLATADGDESTGRLRRCSKRAWRGLDRPGSRARTCLRRGEAENRGASPCQADASPQTHSACCRQRLVPRPKTTARPSAFVAVTELVSPAAREVLGEGPTPVPFWCLLAVDYRSPREQNLGRATKALSRCLRPAASQTGESR